MSSAPRLDTSSDMATRRWPVRLILVGIVFALVLPGGLFCGVLLSRIATAERTRSQESAQATAQRIADTLDREISNLTAGLIALGTSPALDTPALGSNDLDPFAAQARAVSLALGHEMVMADLEGQELVNTRRPSPSPLPRVGSIATLRRVVTTRQPGVSGLFRSSSDDQPSLAVVVPVLRNGQMLYALATDFHPDGISELLRRQKLPEGWISSVVDASDRVIARSQDSDRYIGQLATDDFRRLAVGDRAVWVGNTLEGTGVLAAMQRQRLADWRVGVGVPLSVIEAPLQSTLILLAITGAVTLGIAGLLAWQLADSVARPLQRLARAGDALTTGQPVPGVRSSIAEVDAVSRALVQATSELRARADALADERAQLAAIIETVPVGLVLADAPSGRIVSGNSYFTRMLDQDFGQPAGKDSIHDWITYHADGQRVQPTEYPLFQVLHGAAHAELTCIYQRGDGTTLWVQLIAAPIHAADGSLAGGVVAVLDVDAAMRARAAETQFAENLEAEVAERTAALEAANQRLRDEMTARAAAEEQLHQAQKMEAVGQLTGGIAHDFNNLLTIIIGSLDLLRRRASDDRSLRLLNNALEGSNRAATLVARLLAFSRRQPLTPQPVDANHLVDGMSDLLLRTLGEAIEVKTLLAEGLWQTHADPNQLENALLNLAVNARDAMLTLDRPGGTLTIETRNAVLDAAVAERNPEVAAGDYVQLSATDTGSGMAPDVAAHVWEPFFTTKPPGQGTGLGLSQVHGFVKQSGGHVTLRTGPGEGTTVTIYLPRFEGAGAAAAPIPAAGTAEIRSLTVLVVEDEPGVRRFSAEALRELGHSVLEAGDAMDGLRLLDAHPETSLLFTDLALPQMDGGRLAAEARRRRPGLPVLFTSGYTGNRDSPNSPLEPGDLLLPKPFTLQELAAKLHEAMAGL